MNNLIKNLIEKIEQRFKYQKKILEIDNDIGQIIIRIKKLEEYK